MSDTVKKIVDCLSILLFPSVFAFLGGIIVLIIRAAENKVVEDYTYYLIFIPLAILLISSYARKDDIKTTFFKDRSRVNFREINNDEV